MLGFYGRKIHALSMNQTGRIIAALSSDSLHVANLDEEDDAPFYTYCFRKNKNGQSLLDNCSCAALNEKGDIAAIGGVYNIGKNCYYRVCILQLNKEKSFIENLLYIINLEYYCPASLQIVENSLVINSNNKYHRVYDLNKGESTVKALTEYQKTFIYSLLLRVSLKRNIFYDQGNYHPQTIILTSAEKEAIRLLSRDVLGFIFGDYQYL